MSANQPLRALTVKQPFASLICWGVKPIENRSQKTNIRGKVLIHAGAQFYKGGSEPKTLLTYHQWNNLSGNQQRKLVSQSANHIPLSAIIGEVEIIDCVQDSKCVWAIPGYWHWVLDNAVMYPEPIPCKGALSFWRPQGATVDAIFEQRFLTI